MATASFNQIAARARTIATQTGGDSNQSVVIDSLAGLEAQFNDVVRTYYRTRASDIKFRHDITTTSTVAIGTGTGAVPDLLIREFLVSGDVTDDNNSLVTYFDYAVDGRSGETFDQLGYVWITDDTFNYIAPAPDFGDYTGSLFIECPVFPTLPSSTGDPITWPSETVVDDICSLLANAILGQVAQPA